MKSTIRETPLGRGLRHSGGKFDRRARPWSQLHRRVAIEDGKRNVYLSHGKQHRSRYRNWLIDRFFDNMRRTPQRSEAARRYQQCAINRYFEEDGSNPDPLEFRG